MSSYTPKPHHNLQRLRKTRKWPVYGALPKRLTDWQCVTENELCSWETCRASTADAANLPQRLDVTHAGIKCKYTGWNPGYYWVPLLQHNYCNKNNMNRHTLTTSSWLPGRSRIYAPPLFLFPTRKLWPLIKSKYNLWLSPLNMQYTHWCISCKSSTPVELSRFFAWLYYIVIL